MNVLEVKGLKKKYGSHEAVKGIDFSIGKGEVFSLIGPNGAGKTTTLRMITTLLSITEGDAFINGLSVKSDGDKVRKRITYLPDEAGAYKNMKGISYLKFMADLCTDTAAEAKAAVDFAVFICGLGDRLSDKVGAYSKGMIRKLLISRAVMSKPDLAVLDEPTSGLDLINGMEIRKLVKKLSDEDKMSFLISGHNMMEIEYISNNVAIIDKGIIYAAGSPAKLKSEYNAQNLEEVFIGAVNRDKVGGRNE
jgi:ABC-2 type transport system ATP-binding protein